MGPTLRWLAALAAVAVAMLVTWGVAPGAPVAPAVGAVVGFVLVAAAVLGVSVAVPAFGVRALAWAVVPVLALAVLASRRAPADEIAGAVPVAVSLLSGGTLVGAVIGARIEHASHLLVAAIASTLADAYSVFAPSGVTAQVVQNERLLGVLALPWPILGTRAIEPLLGVGDVVVCALYVVAARELGLGVRRTVIALALAFVAVLVALAIFAVPLPALPFLGVAVVAAHPRTLRFRKGEGRTAVIGLAVLAAVFAVLLLL